MRDWSRCDPLAIAQATVARAVRELDPQALDPARAEQLVETFASIERLGVELAHGAGDGGLRDRERIAS